MKLAAGVIRRTMNHKLAESARACLKNGHRLLDDAEFLEFSEPPTTAYFLSLIAQEEFAKALLWHDRISPS